MKKILKIFFSILIIIVVMGIVFCIIDSLRVHGDDEPIFARIEQLAEGENYSAKINIGLGYKIIRYSAVNGSEVIKIGSLFMKVESPFIEEDSAQEGNSGEVVIIVESGESGESGEKIVKITTFGEKYADTILLEGMEEETNVQDIHSKLGYTMKYYYELFDYTGYEEHDTYVWKELSGDLKSQLTVTDITEGEVYQKALENISKKDDYEEISGEQSERIQKVFYRQYNENDVNKVNKIYIIWFDNLKIMVDMIMPAEAQEGIGAYMEQMVHSITS